MPSELHIKWWTFEVFLCMLYLFTRKCIPKQVISMSNTQHWNAPVKSFKISVKFHQNTQCRSLQDVKSTKSLKWISKHSISAALIYKAKACRPHDWAAFNLVQDTKAWGFVTNNSNQVKFSLAYKLYNLIWNLIWFGFSFYLLDIMKTLLACIFTVRWTLASVSMFCSCFERADWGVVPSRNSSPHWSVLILLAYFTKLSNTSLSYTFI